VWIANGKRPDILRQLFRGEKTGTLFMPKGGSMKSRKRWVGFTARPRGSYIVDDGAAKAVRENGRSLLPIGVVEIKGEFEPGDVVAVETSGGVPIARGLTNYSASEAKLVMGQPTAKIAKIIPNGRYNEMIHRDNLVIL
jgi:glutamate 5-kinase